MDTFLMNLERADTCRKAGQFPEAEALYRSLLAMDPEQAEALVGLGRTLACQGRFNASVASFGQVLARQPDHAGARWGLGLTLHAFGLELVRNGQGEQALVCFSESLRFRPENPEAYLQMGDLLKGQGKPREAILQYERAVALQPDYLDALLRLGMLHAEADRSAAAIKWYQWALAVDPDQEEAHFNLAAMLECEARLAEAQIHRNRAPRPMPLAIETAPAPRRRVLIPWAAGTGNVPIDNLMSPLNTTRIKWIVECSTDEQEASLPPHDLVFNAIGNADIAGFSQARLARFCEGRRVLNPPDRVMGTRRDLLPGLLEGLPHVVVPRVARIRRDEALEPGLLARLAQGGLALPFILRPIANQGGKGAVLVESDTQLEEAISLDADAFYAIAFHDTRGADGHYRKYRMIFVDGRAYPYHLAISQNWLVHYHSAHMLAAPWKREEERRFLEEPLAALGPVALAAVEAIGRRLGLDYAGMDFTVLADGTVLVFEANATMLVHLQDSPDEFPYKHVAVPAIYRAFEAMLQRQETPPAQ